MMEGELIVGELFQYCYLTTQIRALVWNSQSARR